MAKPETNPDGSTNWANKAFNENEHRAHLENNATEQERTRARSEGFRFDDSRPSTAAPSGGGGSSGVSAPPHTIFQDGPTWFFVDATGTPRHIQTMDMLYAIQATGAQQIAVPPGFAAAGQIAAQSNPITTVPPPAPAAQAPRPVAPAPAPAPTPAANPNDSLPLSQWIRTQPANNQAFLEQQSRTDPNFARQFGWTGTNDLPKSPQNTGSPTSPTASSPPGPADPGKVWQQGPNGDWTQVAGTRQPGDLTGGPGQVVNPPSGPGPTGIVSPTKPTQFAPGQAPAGTPIAGKPGTTTGVTGAPDPTGGANRAALNTGDQTFFGPIVGDGENGLPQGLGYNWHELRLKAILDLIGADGQMRDPVSGQVLQGQQSLAAIKQATDLARQQADLMGRDASGANTLERDVSEGTLTGRYGGQNTLDRDKFEETRTQALYNRAANPASIFENELARSSGGSVYDSVTGGVNVGQTPSAVAPVTTPGSGINGFLSDEDIRRGEEYTRQNPDPVRPAPMQQTGQMPSGDMFGAAPQGFMASGAGVQTQAQPTGNFRQPAIITAYRNGLLTPQAGNINAPNVNTTAQGAALKERDVRLANQRTLLSPDQKTMTKSFAAAGGVSGDQFDYLTELNKPKTRSVASVFSGR